MKKTTKRKSKNNKSVLMFGFGLIVLSVMFFFRGTEKDMIFSIIPFTIGVVTLIG